MKNKFPDFKLNLNNILLIGAFQGIGLELAKLLASCNANLLLVGRTKKKGIKAINEIRQINPDIEIDFICLDLYKRENRNKLYKITKQKYPGGIDHLVSFLGSGKTSFGSTVKINLWRDMFEKNFFSVVDLVNILLPLLIKSKKQKSILITSAIAAIERLSAPESYSCSKAALSSYIPHLAKDLVKNNIRVIGINPGNIFFNGGRWEEIIKQKGIKKIKENILKDVTMKRLGLAEEIAWNYLTLMSPRNSFMTGVNIIVDGQQVKKTI